MAIISLARSLVVVVLLLHGVTASGMLSPRQLGLSAPNQGQTATPSLTAIVAKDADALEEPDQAGATVLGHITVGTAVTLIARSPDSSWYIVKAPKGTIGWVGAPLLTIDPSIIMRIPTSGKSNCSCGSRGR